jgi:hypothetical protein
MTRIFRRELDDDDKFVGRLFIERERSLCKQTKKLYFNEFKGSSRCRAGVWIKEALDQPKNVSSKSSSIDVVTETDRKCEDYIIAEIKKKFPLHNVIGEESYAEAGKSGYDFSNSVPNWVIDPIDGTNNFVGFEYFKRISEMLSLGARISIFLCLYWNFNW